MKVKMKRSARRSIIFLILMYVGVTNSIMPSMNASESNNYIEQEFFSEDHLIQIYDSGKTPVLVAAGWSESSLGRMDKYKYLTKGFELNLFI